MDTYDFVSLEDELDRFVRKDEGELCKSIYRCDNIIDKFNIREKASADKPILVAKKNNFPKPFDAVPYPEKFPEQWLTVSFKEFGDLARAYAYVLKKRYNLKPRERVAVMADTNPSNHLLIFALWFLRVTVVEVSPKIGNNIKQMWARLLDIKMAFYDKTLKPFYSEKKEKNETEWTWEWVFPLNENEKNLVAGLDGILCVDMSDEKLADEVIEAKKNGHFIQLKGDSGDCLGIFGTSSSTQAVIKNGQCSVMKFVPTYNYNIHYKYSGYILKNTPNEAVYFLLPPFSHGFGFYERTCHPIRRGGPIVYRTQTEDDLGFNAEVILDDITEVNADIALILPYLYSEFKKLKDSNHPKWPVWEEMFKSRCKGCFVAGGAPIAREVNQWLADDFGIYVSDHYGSTECELILYSDGDAQIPGEEGYLMKVPWIDLYLEPLPDDDDPNIGELYIHSDTNYPGYIKKLNEGEVSEESTLPGLRTDFLNEEYFRMIDGKKFYRIGDIFRRSPITGKYKYIARVDDVMTFATGIKMNPLPFEVSMNELCDNIKLCCLLLDDTKTEAVCFVEPDWKFVKDENGEPIDLSMDASQLSLEEIKKLAKLAQAQVWDRIYGVLDKESGSLATWAKQLTKNNIFIINYGETFPVTEKGSASRRVARLKYSEVLRDISKVINGEMEADEIEIADDQMLQMENKEKKNEKTENKPKNESEKVCNKNKKCVNSCNTKKTQNTKVESKTTKTSQYDLQDMIITIYESLKEHKSPFIEFKDFDPEKSFKKYGVDSLGIMKFTKTMSRKLKKTYSPSMLFNYGTPMLLAKYLLNESSMEEIKSNSFMSNQGSNKIAIIGMGLRLPGAVDSENALWAALVKGKDCVLPLPKDRKLHVGYVKKPSDDLEKGEHNIPRCGYYDTRNTVAKPTQFDAAFFNCSVEEATGLDVKHRWIMETSWEALESAGIAPNTLEKSNTGVFVGVGDGQEIKDLMEKSGSENTIGLHNSGPSSIAGRLSYFYKLYGPSETIDTACSTGATALHDACRAMLFGDCDLSIVTAAKYIYYSHEMSQASRARMTSPNGRCATFDSEADGFAQAEGCVTYILKRLEDAERDNDNILGVILGTSTGQSGERQSISAPSSEGQARCIKRALSVANVDPSEVSYVEAHGTGTPYGDALEIHGLNSVYGGSHTKENPLVVGSIKTNMGHTCEAAGLTGIAKVLLAMKHKTIPKNINFKKLNQEIDLDTVPLMIPTHNLSWDTVDDETPRIAQVSSFGLQGSVACIILQEYIPNKKSKVENKNNNGIVRINRDKHMLIVSAKSRSSLLNLGEKYESVLNNMDDNESVANLCYTTNIGRQHFEHRIVAIGSNAEELAEDLQLQLDELSEKEEKEKMVNKKVFSFISSIFSEEFDEEVSDKMYEDVCYLYRTQVAFKEAFDKCDKICIDVSQSKALLLNIAMTIGESGNEKYIKGWKKEIAANKYINQFMLLAIHYSLSKLLESFGISQSIVIGNKFGEIVAAALSEKLSLKKAFSLINHINTWKKSEEESEEKMIKNIKNWFNEHDSTRDQEKTFDGVYYSCNDQKYYKINESLSVDFWIQYVNKVLNSSFDENELLNGFNNVLSINKDKIIGILNMSYNKEAYETIEKCISTNYNNNNKISQIELYKNKSYLENIYECIRGLFNESVEINWENYHKRIEIESRKPYDLQKVNLPFYQFQRSKFWPM